MQTASSWMKLALSLAKAAQMNDEVPVGALIVHKNQLISTAFNHRETTHCACSHAEVLAIQKACSRLKRWRLHDCSLYVTLEPCIMCAGAAWQARLPHVVFGAYDTKGGAMGSLYQIHSDDRLNHNIQVESGVDSEASSTLLKNFFRNKRKKLPPSR